MKKLSSFHAANCLVLKNRQINAQNTKQPNTTEISSDASQMRNLYFGKIPQNKCQKSYIKLHKSDLF